MDYRGARFYDSDVCRFLSLDPLAADFAGWSAYNYVLGNPVKFVDPDGRAVADPVIISQTTVTPYYRSNGNWAGVIIAQTTTTTSSRLSNYAADDLSKENYLTYGVNITKTKIETIAVNYAFDFNGESGFEMHAVEVNKSSMFEISETYNGSK